ncbi:hypothetical protein PUNSTDRAFT_143315 [Punctularia strigosozonata HHB-11173 SS5]|uniref:uncharacterized protein n=1 Tax=Punctularia strigosozonata (strain HHB-11173) TaxID=741275 RepID=UPI0004416478|nr:uncharacterized protein PUNSTDRAFT_143315 [Punctularia strigosozonata HHB-11173 SS5]EIN09925.1 hypothetical protein PUNSTDRAFT_143315 [Punctularia strigosozonata HHB-11173 SS5]
MTTTNHVAGEGYSGRNPVPTIEKFKAEQERVGVLGESNSQVNGAAQNGDAGVDADQNKSLPPTPAAQPEPKSKQDEKKEMMERLQPPKGAKATDAGKQKGERWVRDPVTGQDVLVKDPQFKGQYFREKGLDNDALDSSHNKLGTALRRAPHPSEKGQDGRYPAPTAADVGNICVQAFPPPLEPVDISKPKQILRTGALVVTALCAVTWWFVATGKNLSWFAFFWRSSLLGTIVGATWVGSENAGRKIEKELERVRMDLHKRRAEEYSPPTPESVEWLNALLKLVWGLVNPDMFVPIVDMIEDVLQASLPGIVSAVRIADLGQGTNPLRIVSMRALADQPGHPDYPREEWVGLDKDTQSKIQAEEKDKGKAEEVDEDQTGDYLNYEISLSYQALPGQSRKLRFHNVHLMLEFFLGVYDWLKIPIPIYAVVEGFVATARLRIQFIQNPPFVRNLTVTLMGVPKVEVSVEPFTKALPNVLDLPLVKQFVEMGIAAAAAQFVAPKSLTLNLAQMLAGDGVKKDTAALGVLVITIHHAVGLSAQDRGGGSDPYIVLAYAKFGKPLYSTRIILGDLNPVWEETAFLLMTDDEVKAEEELSATLWDSDKRSADDLVGRVTVPLTELLKKPNTMTARQDKLQGFEDANSMPGTLYWEVGYYEKMPLNRALMKEDSPNVPKELKDTVGEKVAEKPTVADSQDEADALKTPPDPEVPSGILSIIIHQINNLERQDIKGNTGSREGQAGQDTTEAAEEGEHLPNGYCEIIVNDDMIYKTRVKQYTSMPYFEAGTERFIRDWRETIVRVQVRDARVREKDPVLGIVTVKLSELFKNSSEVTRLFSLQEGVGYGRANISFLFRQVKTTLPRTLLGWDTGTVEVVGGISIEAAPEFQEGFRTKKLTISTTDDEYKVPTSAATVAEGNVSWDPPVDKIRLPVYNRYASAVVFEIGSGGIGPLGADSDFVALCWLKDVPDDEETEIRVPVLRSKKLAQLRQNYINDQTAHTHHYDIVGWLKCTVVLDSGLDPDHEEHQETRDEKHRYEAYDRVEGSAVIAAKNAHANDDGVIDPKEAKALKQEKTHQLNMRHRGVMQYAPVRTAKWSKEGLVRRAKTIKDKISGNKSREPTVETEA